MAEPRIDPFGALTPIDLPEGPTSYYSLSRLESEGVVSSLDRLPFSIRILLENALRHAGGAYVSKEHVAAVASWSPTNAGADVPFMPSRVVLQDFTGVPAVVDLAAMRNGIEALGGDPSRINPVVPADLVIDHSVQVDYFGTADAFRLNVEREFQRNRERYALLRWAQEAFRGFSVVPPGTGIVHQVNLEYLASVMHRREQGGTMVAFPDTLVGTDSHTTMINGLGVVGWGVGGIEAEAVMLGQPYYMLLPEVVGMKLTGTLPEGATATDLVLRVTELLRRHGVVGRFVEYYGAGLSSLSLPDKATLANMSPEYGATIGFFPVDEEALRYLRGTGRSENLVARVERVSRELGLFRTDDTPDPEFTSTLALDLGTVEPSLAGPKRPQDRIRLVDMRSTFARDLPALLPKGFSLPGPQKAVGEGQDRPSESWAGEGGNEPVRVGADVVSAKSGTVAAPSAPGRAVHVEADGHAYEIGDGTVVIAAITSCTNTSNPSVMVGAGLLAKKAVERGLDRGPLGEDEHGAGLEGRHRLPERGGPHAAPRPPGLPGGRLRLHDVHRQQRSAAREDPRGGREERPGGGRGPLGEPELRGAHPSRSCARTTWLRRCSSSRTRSRAASTSTSTTSRSAATRDGKPVFLADIWPTAEEVKDTIASALKPRDVRGALRRGLRGRRELARRSRSRRRATSTPGTPRPRTSSAHPSSRGCPSTSASPRTSRAPASSPSSDSRSPPTTSRRRAPSRRTSPRDATCARTASRCGTSTPSALGAATMR